MTLIFMTDIYIDFRDFDKDGTIIIRPNLPCEAQCYRTKYDEARIRKIRGELTAQGHRDFEFILMAHQGQGAKADSLARRIAYLFNT